MRRRLAAPLLATLTVASAAAILAAGSVAAPAILKVKCRASFTGRAGQLKGQQLGVAKCRSPLGHGVQVTTYSETVSATGHVTVTGRTKTFFDLGTVSGPFRQSGQLVGTTGTVTGSGRVTRGTGAYRHARGTVRVKCSTSDAGAHIGCVYTLRFRRL